VTDTPPIPGTLEANDLVVRDASGNPVPLGTRMIEKESYERIIEGLRMSSDAAQHLAGHEPDSAGAWRSISLKLDQCRRIAVQHAGLGLVIQENETKAKQGGDLMRYKPARQRFREGLQQASGGMRQLATCFRNDITWSAMARQIEDMERTMGGTMPSQGVKSGAGLILPPGFGS
jgi:hypothetical protein